MTDGRLDATLIAEHIAPDLGRGIDGAMYEYRDGVYVRDDEIITRRVARALGHKYSTTVQKQTEAHLLNVTLPSIGVRDLPSGYLDYIVVRNGVYRWRDDRLDFHDPLLGAMTCLPIYYDPEAECPSFEAWLTQVLGNEPELLRHVWEIIGYVLMTGNPFQKIILFVGPGGNGKGTMLRILQRLLGVDNYSAISLHTLVEDRFAAAGLYGMIANISGDLSSKFVNEPEILKQITGGDPLTTARKYGQMFTFVPFVVPVFAANDYFRTSDASYGWRRRWEVVDFNVDVSQLDPIDEQDLFDELPGIFNRAMVALRRLMERGRFDPPGAAQEATRRLHDSADPFMMWLDDDEYVEVAEGVSSTRSDVYDRYKRWSRKNGYQPAAVGPFGNRLKQLGITTTRRGDGRSAPRVRYYEGIQVFVAPPGDDE